MDVSDIKSTSATSVGYTLPPGICETGDINLILRCLLPDNVKINMTIDDIRLKSFLTTKKSNTFTIKSFLYYNRIYSISFRLGDNEDFVQLIPDLYKNDKLISIKAIDKVHL